MSGVKTDVYILAGAAQDALGPPIRPVAIHWSAGEVVAIGSPEAVPCPRGARIIERPSHLVLPGLVNAHAHLDLTSLGPQPYGGDFIEWIDFVRGARPTDPFALADAVRLGIEKSIAGGTAIVGDIAGVGSTVPWDVLRADGRLRGISFVEFFGLGPRQARAIEVMEELWAEVSPDADSRVQMGLQPHAPYSAGPEIYNAAARLSAARGRPASTHLAETPGEIEFTRSATGPHADYLRRIGKWDESIRAAQAHPIDLFLRSLSGAATWLAAHVNYCEFRHVNALAESLAAVVYCPRASVYFRHDEHSWREMLDGGVRLALGTDSIVNLDTPQRLSILDEMALLHKRDHVHPAVLLRLATIEGARALHVDERLVTLEPGPCAGLIAVEFDPADGRDALAQALSDPGPIEWLARG